MTQDFKRELLEYFKNIPDPTTQERRILTTLQNEIVFFDLTSIHRDDIRIKGYNADCLTDAEMERISHKLTDCYLDNGFWEDLACTLDYMGVPKLNDNAENDE